MQKFEEAYLNWQKNGMEDFITPLADADTSAKEFSKEVAEIAYNLNFSDLFEPKIDNARYTDGYYNLRKILPSHQTKEKRQLIARFAKDFKKFTTNETNPARENFATKSFLKMCGYFNEGIIKENNYASGSKLLLKFYANVMQNLPDITTRDNSDIHNFTDKTWATQFGSWRGCYTMRNEDYLRRLKILNTAVTKLQDFDKIMYLNEGLHNYLRNVPEISDDFMAGIEQNMIPRLKKENEISKEVNLWGIYDFDMGIGDFDYKALTTRPTPDNLASLMQFYKEIPTTDWDTFNQNRLDGLALQNLNSTFGNTKGIENLRDTIHSERPQTADLIGAMVRYYDAVQNHENVEEIKSKMLILNRQNIGYEIDEKYLVDVNNYNIRVPHYENTSVKEPVIDILRRLDVNMHQSMKLPQNLDISLLQAAQAADGNKEKLGEFLKRLNQNLEKNIIQGKVGIEPEMVHLLVWTDKKCAEIINGLDYEYQYGAYRAPWFKEAVKFNCLTSRERKHFSSAAFDRYYDRDAERLGAKQMYQKIARLQYGFLSRAQKKFLKTGITNLREAIADLQPQNAAKMLSKKTLESGENEIIEKFNRQEKLSAKENKVMLIILQYHNRLESINSGNLSNALQNMLVPHQPSTKIGERRRNEELGLGPILSPFGRSSR